MLQSKRKGRKPTGMRYIRKTYSLPPDIADYIDKVAFRKNVRSNMVVRAWAEQDRSRSDYEN